MYKYIIVLLFLFGCEQKEEIILVEEKKYHLSEIMEEGCYWEGGEQEYENFINSNKSFTGVIKVLDFNGCVLFIKKYSRGLKDGDFYAWHDNGKLASKFQYKDGLRHGYHYEWLPNGNIFSRKKYEEDLEIIDYFKDDINTEFLDLHTASLSDWNGTGSEFYKKFAGDPKEGGFIYIRKTEKPYTGTITAIDDYGNKEAVLRFKDGKYHGIISKWDLNGSLVEEQEFARGELVDYKIKNGEPFFPEKIINISKNPNLLPLLFK